MSIITWLRDGFAFDCLDLSVIVLCCVVINFVGNRFTLIAAFGISSFVCGFVVLPCALCAF